MTTPTSPPPTSPPPAATDWGHKPTRRCHICGATDDHPKHVAELGGGQERSHHHDCGATGMDPGCGVCRELVGGLPDGAIGDDMRAHLTAQKQKVFEHGEGGDPHQVVAVHAADTTQEG